MEAGSCSGLGGSDGEGVLSSPNTAGDDDIPADESGVGATVTLGLGEGDGESEGDELGLGVRVGVGVGVEVGFGVTITGFGVGVLVGVGVDTTVELPPDEPPHITMLEYKQLDPLHPSLQITFPLD